jgi:hypothetical protein
MLSRFDGIPIGWHCAAVRVCGERCDAALDARGAPMVWPGRTEAERVLAELAQSGSKDADEAADDPELDAAFALLQAHPEHPESERIAYACAYGTCTRDAVMWAANVVRQALPPDG